MKESSLIVKIFAFQIISSKKFKDLRKLLIDDINDEAPIHMPENVNKFKSKIFLLHIKVRTNFRSNFVWPNVFLETAKKVEMSDKSANTLPHCCPFFVVCCASVKGEKVYCITL